MNSLLVTKLINNFIVDDLNSGATVTFTRAYFTTKRLTMSLILTKYIPEAQEDFISC